MDNYAGLLKISFFPAFDFDRRSYVQYILVPISYRNTNVYIIISLTNIFQVLLPIFQQLPFWTSTAILPAPRIYR